MTKSETIEDIIEIAKKEVGTREATGRNDGKRVETYLAAVGLGKGFAWCAAFVTWVLELAGLGAVWSPDNRAYCPSIYTWARLKGILHKKPQRGDVFLYMENGWALHTGFVTGAGEGRFTTIEGNTNPAGSAEGDGVYERSRPDNGRYVFVRVVDLMVDTAPTVIPTFALIVRGKKVADMEVRHERSYVQLRDLSDALGYPLTWDSNAHKPRIKGQLVAADVEYREGKSYAQVGAVLKMLGRPYKVDLPGRRVVVL